MVILFDLNILFVYMSLSYVKENSLEKVNMIHWITGERYIEIMLTFLLIQRLF